MKSTAEGNMNYCTECVYPDTKPDLAFNADGVCSACTSYADRGKTDWIERASWFQKFRQEARKLSAPYDAIVPVSGGKDSTWQILKCLEYGMHILAVTAVTDDLSNLGRRNLDNIAKLGVDHIEVKTNPVVRARISKYALEEIGDCSWPEHVTIFTIPYRIAVEKHIPFILWGENPQNQYGGPQGSQDATTLDRRWLEEYGGLQGLRVADIIDAGIAGPEDMWPYMFPSSTELMDNCVTGRFMGHYFSWSGYENAQISMAHNWEPWAIPVEGTGFDYENLDNLQTGIRDYIKWLKYGAGRASDMAATAIRERRMTRKEGIEHVKRWDGQFPWTYLGQPIERILSRINVTIDEYIDICNRFTNKRLFRLGNNVRPEPLFQVQ